MDNKIIELSKGKQIELQERQRLFFGVFLF